jgi:quercetin dioxygenase-like cupin family protein
MAADPIEVASNVYTTLFENERVRLLEVRLAGGDSSEMHGHPDYVVYNLDDGKVRFSAPSGDTEEVELPAGTAMWREAEEHATENLGATEVRALLFELK